MPDSVSKTKKLPSFVVSNKAADAAELETTLQPSATSRVVVVRTTVRFGSLCFVVISARNRGHGSPGSYVRLSTLCIAENYE